MKVYELTGRIEADDEISEEQVLEIINRDLNRGDGIYLAVEAITLVEQKP